MGKFIIGIIGALLIGIGAYMSKPAGIGEFDAPKEVVAQKLETMPANLFAPFAKTLNISLTDPAVSKDADGNIIWKFASAKGPVELMAKLYEGFSGRTSVEFTIDFKNDPEMSSMPMTQTLAQMAGAHAANAQMTTGEIDAFRFDQDYTEYASINGQAMMMYKTRGMFNDVNASMDKAVENFDAQAADRKDRANRAASAPSGSFAGPTTGVSGR